MSKWLSRRARFAGRVAGPLTLALAALLIACSGSQQAAPDGASPTERPASQVQARDPGDLHVGYIDQTNGNYFLAQLTRGDDEYGTFEFGVRGLGVFWNEGARANVTKANDGTTTVSYTGTGILFRNGTWILGMPTEVGDRGREEPSTFTLAATFSPNHVTGEAVLTVGAQVYRAGGTAPAHNADAAVAKVMDLHKAKDWKGYYALNYSEFVEDVSADEFAEEMARADAAEGSLAEWCFTGPVVYKGEPGPGMRIALVPVKAVFGQGSGRHSLDANVVMVEELGQWLMVSTEPLRPGGPGPKCLGS